MTARDVADRLGARPAGDGRWMARCPAHSDHTPSLSVREGAGGKVLVHCWAGCDTSAVLAAAGLTWRDISGQPTTPADRARLRAERQQRTETERAERRRERACTDLLRSADESLALLAARLAAVEFAGAPGDGEALAQQYHALIDRSRKAEVAYVA